MRASPPPLAKLPRRQQLLLQPAVFHVQQDSDDDDFTRFSAAVTQPINEGHRETDFPGGGGEGDGEGSDVTRLKCVLVGDGAIGKTSLIVSYTTNGYPTEYEPTAFDNYAVVVTVDSQPIRLQLCDTAGQDDFDSLRPLCYPGTDVFLLCFSVVSPASFQNLTTKWLPEIRKHAPGAAVVLVGTQSDLRGDVRELIQLAQYHEQPVTTEQAREALSELRASQYVECSALTQQNLKEVFDAAILAGLENRGLLRRITTKSKILSKKKSKKNKKKEKEETMSKKSNSSSSSSKSAWRCCCLS